MEKIVVELSDGREVEVMQKYDTECGNIVDVIDHNDKSFIAEFPFTIPDTDDEDFDLAKFIKDIEMEIDWAYN